MRNLPLRLLAAVLLLVDAPAFAYPTASIQWGDCSSPPGTDRDNRYDPNSTSDIASVTIQGLSDTVREVSFKVVLWAGGSQVPDAWRYDANGCGAGLLRVGLLNGSCPFMTGRNRFEATNLEYLAYGGPGWSKGLESIRFVAGFDPVTISDSPPYTVAQLEFNHYNATSACGCLERPLCIGLRDVRYVDADGVEHTFNTYSEGIHWNDPGNSLACPTGPDLCIPDCIWEADTLCVATTAAVQRSWGNLKAGYR